MPCTLQLLSVTPCLGSLCILVVPMWCQPPPNCDGHALSCSLCSHSSMRTRPMFALPACMPMTWYILRMLVLSSGVSCQCGIARGNPNASFDASSVMSDEGLGDCSMRVYKSYTL